MDHLPLTEWVQTIGHTLLAALGGLLAYLMRELDRGNTPSVRRAILEGLSSGFVGYLAFLLCRALDIEGDYTGFIVGVFGWLGAQASIALFGGFMRNRLGITDTAPKREDEGHA